MCGLFWLDSSVEMLQNSLEELNLLLAETRRPGPTSWVLLKSSMLAVGSKSIAGDRCWNCGKKSQLLLKHFLSELGDNEVLRYRPYPAGFEASLGVLVSRFLMEEVKLAFKLGWLLARVGSLFEKKSDLDPKHQNEKLCGDWTGLLMTAHRNHTVWRETELGIQHLLPLDYLPLITWKLWPRKLFQTETVLKEEIG